MEILGGGGSFKKKKTDNDKDQEGNSHQQPETFGKLAAELNADYSRRLSREFIRGDQLVFFFFQAEDGIRDDLVTGVQTCALPILPNPVERCWRRGRGRGSGSA